MKSTHDTLTDEKLECVKAMFSSSLEKEKEWADFILKKPLIKFCGVKLNKDE